MSSTMATRLTEHHLRSTTLRPLISACIQPRFSLTAPNSELMISVLASFLRSLRSLIFCKPMLSRPTFTLGTIVLTSTISSLWTSKIYLYYYTDIIFFLSPESERKNIFTYFLWLDYSKWINFWNFFVFLIKYYPDNIFPSLLHLSPRSAKGNYRLLLGHYRGEHFYLEILLLLN